jgi:hypothetical protein
MIYRKFGYLQSRVLLDKQDQLRVLEKELHKLDEDLYSGKDTWTQTRHHIMDKDLRDERVGLMDRISEAYCSYGLCCTHLCQKSLPCDGTTHIMTS